MHIDISYKKKCEALSVILLSYVDYIELFHRKIRKTFHVVIGYI
jgi:hypothetical protein